MFFLSSNIRGFLDKDFRYRDIVVHGSIEFVQDIEHFSRIKLLEADRHSPE